VFQSMIYVFNEVLFMVVWWNSCLICCLSVWNFRWFFHFIILLLLTMLLSWSMTWGMTFIVVDVSVCRYTSCPKISNPPASNSPNSVCSLWFSTKCHTLHYLNVTSPILPIMTYAPYRVCSVYRHYDVRVCLH